MCAYVRRVARACASANRWRDLLFSTLSLPIKINGLLNDCHSFLTVRWISDLIVCHRARLISFEPGHGAT